MTGKYVYDDGVEAINPDGSHVDFFEREPYVVAFRSTNTGNVHMNRVLFKLSVNLLQNIDI